jgi:hypothetical protein
MRTSKPIPLRTVATLLLAVSLVQALAHGESQSNSPASTALTEPPPGAQTWAVISSAGRNGQAVLWKASDGSRWSRETILLRGQNTDVEEQMRVDANGQLRELRIWGSTPEGLANEQYHATDRGYTFVSPGGRGSGKREPNLAYLPFGGTIENTIWLAERLQKAENHTLRLIPSSRATLRLLTTATVHRRNENKSLTAYAIDGIDFGPLPIWFDGEHYFATVGDLSYVPEGWESVVDVLRTAQTAALAQRGPAILSGVAPRAAIPIAFVDVRIYDADSLVFREHMTLVSDAGRITALGPASATVVPPSAKKFSGAGRTLLPGLWDSHQHYGDGGDSNGPLLLSQGITSIRDPGDDNTETIDRWRRIRDGLLLAPTIYASSLLDGKSRYSAQAAVIVTSEDQALAAVRWASKEGFTGIKIYGSFNPDWVAPTALEAHHLGLHVHGHVPAGMRPLDAIHAGYEEITHINFVMMQFMPDSVVNASNTSERHYGPARYAPDLELESAQVHTYIDELARRHIVVDPTMVTFEKLLSAEQGKLTPAAQPFAGTLPVKVDQYYRIGGLSPRPDVSVAQLHACLGKYKALLAELHRRGVPIVAGTDDYGLDLVRELELYVEAGFTPAEAIAAATIVPAKNLNVADRTGSLAIGKRADLFLVTGDPSRSIAALRHVELVMHDGRLMMGDSLRRAAGLTRMSH